MIMILAMIAGIFIIVGSVYFYLLVGDVLGETAGMFVYGLFALAFARALYGAWRRLPQDPPPPARVKFTSPEVIEDID